MPIYFRSLLFYALTFFSGFGSGFFPCIAFSQIPFERNDIEHSEVEQTELEKKEDGKEGQEWGDVQLEPVVVSAARLEQKLSDTLPATTLITRTQIQRSQARDIPSLLRSEAGIEILQNGGQGTLSSLQMRGASSTQVLVLLDGIEIGSLSSGMPALEHIAASQIDHIEIVRGNVSALYGSPAMGGVVRLFTSPHGAVRSSTRFAVETGSYRTRNLQASYAGQLNDQRKTFISVNVARQLSDSFSSVNTIQAPQANPSDHGYQNTSFTGQLRHNFGVGWDGGVRLFQSDGLTHFATPYGAVTDTNYARTRLRNIALFVNGPMTERWQAKLSFARNDDINHSYSRSVFGDSTYLFHTVNHKFIFQNEMRWMDTPSLMQASVLGYEYMRSTFDSNSYQAPTRRTDALFLGHHLRLDKHQLQINLRNDHYSDFGSAQTYFIGYGYAVSPQLKSYLNLSSAFRAPTFNELYYPGAGNSQLKAEQARSLETGLHYTHARGDARIAVFQTNYRDLVSYIRSGSSIYSTPINTRRAQITGVEMALSQQLGSVDLQVNATLQNPKDLSQNIILPSRVRQFGAVSVNKKFGKWDIGAAWKISGKRFDISDPSAKKWLGGYSVIDLSGHYNLTKEWTFSAKLENLFDRDYQLISRYNTPRRAIYISLAWQSRR